MTIYTENGINVLGGTAVTSSNPVPGTTHTMVQGQVAYTPDSIHSTYNVNETSVSGIIPSKDLFVYLLNEQAVIQPTPSSNAYRLNTEVAYSGPVVSTMNEINVYMLNEQVAIQPAAQGLAPAVFETVVTKTEPKPIDINVFMLQQEYAIVPVGTIWYQNVHETIVMGVPPPASVSSVYMFQEQVIFSPSGETNVYNVNETVVTGINSSTASVDVYAVDQELVITPDGTGVTPTVFETVVCQTPYTGVPQLNTYVATEQIAFVPDAMNNVSNVHETVVTSLSQQPSINAYAIDEEVVLTPDGAGVTPTVYETVVVTVPFTVTPITNVYGAYEQIAFIPETFTNAYNVHETIVTSQLPPPIIAYATTVYNTAVVSVRSSDKLGIQDYAVHETVVIGIPRELKARFTASVMVTYAAADITQ